jgi:hypothetical protein
LRALLAIQGITKAQARQIAETKLAFEGDVVEIGPVGAGGWAGAAPTAAPPTSGQPAACPDRGPTQLEAFAPSRPDGATDVGADPA